MELLENFCQERGIFLIKLSTPYKYSIVYLAALNTIFIWSNATEKNIDTFLVDGFGFAKVGDVA